MTFPRSNPIYILSYLRDLAYPLSHSFTSSIKSITSQMSLLSNHNSDNTRSVTQSKPAYPPLLSKQYTPYSHTDMALYFINRGLFNSSILGLQNKPLFIQFRAILVKLQGVLFLGGGELDQLAQSDPLPLVESQSRKSFYYRRQAGL